MKRIKQSITVAILIGLLSIASLPVIAYDPPPPPPIGGNGDQDPPGGGAPINGGILILVGLAAGYAWYKIYRDNNPEDLESFEISGI